MGQWSAAFFFSQSLSGLSQLDMPCNAGVGEALLFEITSTFQEISEISHMLQRKLMGDVWWDRFRRFRYGPLERLKRIINRLLGRNQNVFQPHLDDMLALSNFEFVIDETKVNTLTCLVVLIGVIDACQFHHGSCIVVLYGSHEPKHSCW